MFSTVSWGLFSAVLLLLTAIYYLLFFLIFYWKAFLRRLRNKAGPLLLCLLASGLLHAQDGKKGISLANDMIREYFDAAVPLMYAVGAVMGLIGAIRVYAAINGGHRDEAQQRSAAWFAACIFLVVAATLIKSFFGL